MGKEINLLRNYPKANRNLDNRSKNKTNKIVRIARKFGKDFFDGDRKYGYGGFIYNKKYWSKVVVDFKNYWKLTSKNSLLDVGCGKGFMLYDLKKIIPSIKIAGIDISKYAIKNACSSVKKFLKIGNAKKMSFADKSFDYVISINTIHNLPKSECASALREIQRISNKGSFVVVDAYRNLKEKKRMMKWNLTAKTIMSVKQWKLFFKKNGYRGDYYWFIP